MIKVEEENNIKIYYTSKVSAIIVFTLGVFFLMMNMLGIMKEEVF